MNLSELTLNNAADLAVVYAKAGLSHAAYHAIEVARAAFRLHPEMREPMHERDSDCTVDEDTLCCKYCGVDHSDECPDCGGRGFHKPICETLERMFLRGKESRKELGGVSAQEKPPTALEWAQTKVADRAWVGLMTRDELALHLADAYLEGALNAAKRIQGTATDAPA